MLVHHEWIFIDHFWILAPGNLEISQGIEYKLYAIFCTFAIEMYYHIVHNGSIPWVKFLESFFKLSYLLIRGLMKGLSPNFPIFSSSSTEMHLFVMHYGMKVLENFCLLIMGIVFSKYFRVFGN